MGTSLGSSSGQCQRRTSTIHSHPIAPNSTNSNCRRFRLPGDAQLPGASFHKPTLQEPQDPVSGTPGNYSQCRGRLCFTYIDTSGCQQPRPGRASPPHTKRPGPNGWRQKTERAEDQWGPFRALLPPPLGALLIFPELPPERQLNKIAPRGGRAWESETAMG